MEDSESPTNLTRTAKRARNGSPDVSKNAKDGKANTLVSDARRIQESLRAYLKRNDKKSVGSIRNHISNKIQCLVDMIETLEDGRKDGSVSSFVEKAINETLLSQKVRDMLTQIIIEASVPKVIEALSATSNISQLKHIYPGSSRELQSTASEPIGESSREVEQQMPRGDIDQALSLANTRPFETVVSKRNKRKAKAAAKSEDDSSKEPKSNEKKPKSMAEIVKSLPKKPTQTLRPTYITISGTGKSPVDIINGLPSPKEIGVNAAIVRATKAGSVLVRMDDINDATKVIGWQGLRDHGLQAKLALKKKPRLEIRGVPHTWNSAELARFLWERLPEKSGPTPLIMDDLRPLFSSVARNGFTKNWVLEVHPTVRFLLLEIGSLDGGWWTITFKDYVDAPRCSRCQGYGHTKATCTVDAVVCIWCSASGHVIKECPKKREQASPTCINCARANAPVVQRKHKAGSRECPVHLQWAKEVAKRTFYE